MIGETDTDPKRMEWEETMDRLDREISRRQMEVKRLCETEDMAGFDHLFPPSRRWGGLHPNDFERVVETVCQSGKRDPIDYILTRWKGHLDRDTYGDEERASAISNLAMEIVDSESPYAAEVFLTKVPEAANYLLHWSAREIDFRRRATDIIRIACERGATNLNEAMRRLPYSDPDAIRILLRYGATTDDGFLPGMDRNGWYTTEELHRLQALLRSNRVKAGLPEVEESRPPRELP